MTPSGKPTLASLSDAETALSSGTALLEDRAREKYTASDLAKPSTFTFTIPLSASETLGWLYSWCAKDTATLDQNFKSIQLKFTLDGTDMTRQMYTADVSSGGQACRLVFAVLSQWPAGEHHLTTTATFTSAINDGTADYPAGDYIMDYTVYVKP